VVNKVHRQTHTGTQMTGGTQGTTQTDKTHTCVAFVDDTENRKPNLQVTNNNKLSDSSELIYNVV